MTFFNHPEERPVEPRMSSSVFARVDQVEVISESDRVYLLDCIETKWVEEFGNRKTPLFALGGDVGEMADQALSIIVADAKLLTNLPGEWFKITFSDRDDYATVDQYTAFFSNPNPRSIFPIEPVTHEQSLLLNFLAGWDGIKGDEPADIQTALKSVPDPDAVAIYDVGQGAATALLSDGTPSLYFDFGGSAIGNWRSFPPGLHSFCFSNKPPIILSHWDWDHWSSALRDRQAFDSTWIVPQQAQAGTLGNVHARFLAMLITHRTKVLWWPPSLLQISIPNVSAAIVKSSGPATNRNESGLALIVNGIHRSVLLPGDASYRHLAKAVVTQLDHVMVPHHGGKTDVSQLPIATTKSRSHKIYSYGVGNIFTHPRADVVKAYRTEWKKNAHTALRAGSEFGHVGIDLTGQRGGAAPVLPCGGRQCQLQIQQWLQ